MAKIRNTVETINKLAAIEFRRSGCVRTGYFIRGSVRRADIEGMIDLNEKTEAELALDRKLPVAQSRFQATRLKVRRLRSRPAAAHRPCPFFERKPMNDIRLAC